MDRPPAPKKMQLEAALRDGAAARASGDAAAYAVAAIAAARAVSYGATPAAGGMPSALELLLSLLFSDSEEVVCLAAHAMQSCLEMQFHANGRTGDPTLNLSGLFSVSVLQRLVQLIDHTSPQLVSAVMTMLGGLCVYKSKEDMRDLGARLAQCGVCKAMACVLAEGSARLKEGACCSLGSSINVISSQTVTCGILQTPGVLQALQA